MNLHEPLFDFAIRGCEAVSDSFYIQWLGTLFAADAEKFRQKIVDWLNPSREFFKKLTLKAIRCRTYRAPCGSGA
jgi:hypothetical protein